MKKIFKKIIQFYLKILTKIIVWRKNPLIIAIVGKTNKTFIKDAILNEMSSRGNLIRGNPRSFNTEIGLPLAVLFLPSGYSSVFKWVDILLAGTCISLFGSNFPKILVLEMGVEEKGDMKYLLSMIKPRIVVVTNIDKNFPDYGAGSELMFQEIKTLAENLSQNGILVLNSDDSRVRNLKNETKAKVVLYGTKKDCHAKIKNIKDTEKGQKFDFYYQNKKESFKINKFGKHNIYSLVAVRIVVDYLNKYIFFKK